jgi:hypothetical protein
MQLFCIICLVTAVSTAQDMLKIDFSRIGGDVQAGYEGYLARHEDLTTFTAQSYSAFGGTITVKPTWATGASNAIAQMYVRPKWTMLDYADLFYDWIGTDNRQAIGNPLTLTIGGLPAGIYTWVSYHHDLADGSTGGYQTGLFDVTVNDAAGSATTTGVDISSASPRGEGIVNFADVTKFTTQIKSNGSDITLVFHQQVSTPQPECFFLMSGFEITRVLTAALAQNPYPADGAADVPAPVTLSWMPGNYAPAVDGHKVFLSDNFADVDEGLAAAERGIVSDPVFDTAALSLALEFGTTYYWRVDEANLPNGMWDGGDIWSFTIEPFAYPIENITATASSVNRAEEGPENTVNGSGLDDDDLHSSENTDMWLSDGADQNAAWIQYEFDRVHKLYQMLVWNYNSSVELIVGFSIKQATIEYSVDGTNWTTLGTTHEFTKGPGAAGYAPNTTVDLGGVTAKYVRITANSNWGGMVNQYGLSEVRFLYVPVLATGPSPNSGATNSGVDAILSWKAGREASKHDVYISTDEQAVIDGTASVTTVTEPSYASSLDLNSTYYWRVDEINDSETPTTWQGDIWNLSTQEYLVVDDFESYNEIPAGDEGSNLIYETWIDGFGVTTNGSTIGYTVAFQPSMETSTVYDGKQSVPLFYDNTTATYSEVTASIADLGVGKDWTKHGIKALTLRFYGDPANTAQQMYVKINGSKVTYDGGAQAIKQSVWQMWYIDLASMGVNLSNVTNLTIGFERIGASGGQGMVLLDGIRLYSYDRQLVTPIDPGTAALQAQYQFEGNTNDSSGKGRNGTAHGDPIFVAGKVGQAIRFNGLNQYVNVDGYKGILADASGVQQPFTITAWVRTIDSGDRTIASWGTNTSRYRVDFRLFEGRLRVEHGAGNVQGDTALNDDDWHHVALTMVQGATASYPDVQLWLDGKDNTRPSSDPDAFSIAADVDMAMGYRATAADRYFLGAIDDVRLYDGSLSAEEIAWLADLTKPFDKPF